MRVLHVNKFGWRKGGSEVYMLSTCEHLVASGIEVGLWATEQAPMPGVHAFEASIPDFHGARSIHKKLGAATTVIWSRTAQRELADVLDAFAPDVVHLHLYAHQFSSSILGLLRERGIPSVATAHDYKLICPAYLSVRRGHDCFRCAQRLSPVAIHERCLHGKVSWSAVAVAEAKLVRMRRLLPDIVVAPSEFMVERLKASWLDGNVDLRLIRHPVMPSGLEWHGGGAYLLYVGRLSSEKGVEALVAQARELKIPLVVAGDGPERARLERAGTGADVTFVGHVDRSTLSRLRVNCLAQVVPSAWPENFPLAALEAAADGVPLIVSPRGGAPELLELGARGVVADVATPSSLASALAELARSDRVETDEGVEKLRTALTWDSHMSALLETYMHACSRVRRKRTAAAGGSTSLVGRQV